MTEKRWDHAINWDDTFICDQCGEEMEPWLDSYCGHEFVEKEVCQKCSENDGADVLGGWDEDALRDR